MKCRECQTEIPDTALSCPHCGTPTRTTTSFSYLPAGAPPWPTSAPASTATAVKQAAESVTTSTPKKIPDDKPRRSAGSVISAILLLILSVVVGVGATLAILAANGSLTSPGTTSKQSAHLSAPAATTAAATPTTGTVATGTGTPAATPTTAAQGNQLPTPSSFVVVKVTEVGVSLKYPADWKQENPQTTANYSAVELHPQQQLGIDFVVQRLSASASAQVKSLEDLNQSILQPSSNDTTIHNFKLVQAVNPAPMIAGVSWAEQDANFTNSQGILFREVSISVKHSGLYYTISYLAPEIVYAEAMHKYYSQMLTSFQFTS